MNSELSAFFDSMLPFLMGEGTEADLAARLGPSTSGGLRVTLHRTLVWRERVGVLRALFPTTLALSERLEPGLCAALESGHLALHRSSFWEPNRVGESFPPFVEARCASDPRLEVLVELADYEWLRYRVTVKPRAEVHFRSYRFDVPSIVDSSRRGTGAALPAAAPVVVAVHASTGHRAAWTRLGAAELAALARRRGLPPPEPPVPVEAVDAADGWLTRRGVLAPASPPLP